MLELVKLVKALENTRIFVSLEVTCIMAQCTECGHLYDTHLCDMTSLLDVLPMLMKHQESH